MCWWAFTGLTHIILEGYFVFSPEFFKDNTSCYLAEVCKFFYILLLSVVIVVQVDQFVSSFTGKEYSKGDSRYAGRDSAVVSVEGITAVIVGPACLLAM